MDENNSIQLFEDRKIRTAWDEEQEEWYFSVVDVIAVLTDSSNPTDYLKKMRKRDEQLASYLGTNCPQVAQFVKEYSPKSLRNREGFWYNRRKPPREAPSWKSTPKTPAAKQWLLT